MGEAGDRRSDTPMDMEMEMTTAATPTATETASGTMFELTERTENGKWRRTSKAPATPSDWRSRMERTMPQQGQELTQLHGTVQHLTNLVPAQAACKEVQWLGMRTWMQERAYMGCPLQGQQAVRGGNHKYDHEHRERSSMRPRTERERNRRDRRVGRRRARDLATCRYDARRGTREAPAAAAATEANNCSSNCSLNSSLQPSQNQCAHPVDGGRPSHSELRVGGHASAKAPP